MVFQRSQDIAMGYGPIKHFTDIEAWKLARKLRVAVYNGVKKLPREEKYELAAPVKWSLRSQLNGLEGFNPSTIVNYLRGRRDKNLTG